jgi:hypothetical protein
MPAEFAMVLHPSGTALVPADSTQADALLRLREMGMRGRVHVSICQPRHPAAHRRLFALLQHLYQSWEPAEASPAVPPRRSFNAFRSHIVILAGHYQQAWRADGTFILEPMSLAFDAMDQIDLDDLFGRVIDVALEQIPAFHGRLREDVEMDIERVTAFVR